MYVSLRTQAKDLSCAWPGTNLKSKIYYAFESPTGQIRFVSTQLEAFVSTQLNPFVPTGSVFNFYVSVSKNSWLRSGWESGPSVEVLVRMEKRTTELVEIFLEQAS